MRSLLTRWPPCQELSMPGGKVYGVQVGINVKKGTVTNMREAKVVQPLLVTKSALELATEAVRMILKIDDIVPVR